MRRLIEWLDRVTTVPTESPAKPMTDKDLVNRIAMSDSPRMEMWLGWLDPETTEHKCLDFIHMMCQRMVYGKFRIMSTQGIRLVDVTIHSHHVVYYKDGSVLVDFGSELFKPIASGVPMSVQIVDREGLTIPVHHSQVDPTPISLVIPVKLSCLIRWDNLLAVARYHDQWGK